ncbi:glycosyl hydrolase family 28-related protein [Pseudoroseomonas wenyumeiae]
MANSKISELPTAATLADADIAALVQGSAALAVTRRTTIAAMRNAMLADRPLHVRDYGAVGDGITDDTAAFQRAIDTAAAQGGGVVLLGPRRYLVSGGDITVKNGVFLRGRTSAGGWRQNGDFTSVNHAILLDPARTIRVQRNGGLEGLAVLRRGMTVPTNLREGLDAMAAFAGTAITVGDGSGGGGNGNGADTTLAGLLILGFNWGIYSHGNARLRVKDVLGDARNGLFIGNAFDVCRISEVNWHPLVTTGRIWSNTRIAIGNVTDNGAGRFRVTLTGEHSLKTGELMNISEVRSSGCPGLYGRWSVTVVDSTRVDLDNSTYVAGWAPAAPPISSRTAALAPPSPSPAPTWRPSRTASNTATTSASTSMATCMPAPSPISASMAGWMRRTPPPSASASAAPPSATSSLAASCPPRAFPCRSRPRARSSTRSSASM